MSANGRKNDEKTSRSAAGTSKALGRDDEKGKRKRKCASEKRNSSERLDELSFGERYSIEDTQDHFVPRKLFLKGVETFKSVPKLNVVARVENMEEEEPIISLTYGDKSEPKQKREAKKKPTLKNCLRRFFVSH